jgi:hypothetical protein
MSDQKTSLTRPHLPILCVHVPSRGISTVGQRLGGQRNHVEHARRGTEPQLMGPVRGGVGVGMSGESCPLSRGALLYC